MTEVTRWPAYCVDGAKKKLAALPWALAMAAFELP